jgi:hypothetical protein
MGQVLREQTGVAILRNGDERQKHAQFITIGTAATSGVLVLGVPVLAGAAHIDMPRICGSGTVRAGGCDRRPALIGRGLCASRVAFFGAPIVLIYKF